MIEQLTYRFTSRSKLLERRAVQGMQEALATTDDIRAANDMVIDRLKKDFALTEKSTIGDMRKAVGRLAE